MSNFITKLTEDKFSDASFESSKSKSGKALFSKKELEKDKLFSVDRCEKYKTQKEAQDAYDHWKSTKSSLEQEQKPFFPYYYKPRPFTWNTKEGNGPKLRRDWSMFMNLVYEYTEKLIFLLHEETRSTWIHSKDKNIVIKDVIDKDERIEYAMNVLSKTTFNRVMGCCSWSKKYRRSFIRLKPNLATIPFGDKECLSFYPESNDPYGLKRCLPSIKGIIDGIDNGYMDKGIEKWAEEDGKLSIEQHKEKEKESLIRSHNKEKEARDNIKYWKGYADPDDAYNYWLRMMRKSTLIDGMKSGMGGGPGYEREMQGKTIRFVTDREADRHEEWVYEKIKHFQLEAEELGLSNVEWNKRRDGLDRRQWRALREWEKRIDRIEKILGIDKLHTDNYNWNPSEEDEAAWWSAFMQLKNLKVETFLGRKDTRKQTKNFVLPRVLKNYKRFNGKDILEIEGIRIDFDERWEIIRNTPYNDLSSDQKEYVEFRENGVRHDNYIKFSNDKEQAIRYHLNRKYGIKMDVFGKVIMNDRDKLKKKLRQYGSFIFNGVIYRKVIEEEPYKSPFPWKAPVDTDRVSTIERFWFPAWSLKREDIFWNDYEFMKQVECEVAYGKSVEKVKDMFLEKEKNWKIGEKNISARLPGL